MQVEQVGRGVAVQEFLDALGGGVPVAEPGPEADRPGPAPAGTPAVSGEPGLPRAAGRPRRRRGVYRIDGGARVQAVEVREVPVSRLVLGERLRPLLEPPVRTDHRL